MGGGIDKEQMYTMGIYLYDIADDPVIQTPDALSYLDLLVYERPFECNNGEQRAQEEQQGLSSRCIRWWLGRVQVVRHRGGRSVGLLSGN